MKRFGLAIATLVALANCVPAFAGPSADGICHLRADLPALVASTSGPAGVERFGDVTGEEAEKLALALKTPDVGMLTFVAYDEGDETMFGIFMFGKDGCFIGRSAGRLSQSGLVKLYKRAGAKPHHKQS